ncbi:ECF RNA polymerase sigma factor SigL [Planctomycetes bacterium Poly30]|uniref:ECF RNA polymerase sigma factor SigL n=1 Tax=Saltatorellus ferox TaxID=2528018 RepID=A0A518EW22_9BACT|nr:ECF RNA polymerase sigma factor SigL [Planctomycetes bacterium Poly30]
MTPEQDSQRIESMLAHSEWVRAMARRLITDPSRADDVVQEGWLVALRRPPKTATNLRGWWSTVIRNQARQMGRSEGRRRERERKASKPESQSDLEELARRASVQREVVGHVLKLDEPFRGVVLLRFFEDLSPPEIAERLGVPLKTVHSRLQRAFDKLRLELDRDYGDRHSWCTALLPLAGLKETIMAPASTSLVSTMGPGSVAGAWIMSANVKLVAALGVVLLGGWGASMFLWKPNQPSPGAQDRIVAASDSLLADTTSRLAPPPASRPAAPTTRTELTTRVQAEEDSMATPRPEPISVRGKAINMRGEPIGDVDVSFIGQDRLASARTGGDGRFELQYLPSGSGPRWNSTSDDSCLRVEDDDWITIRPSCVDEMNQEREHLVVAARVQSIKGRVQDSGGAPIVGASMRLSPQGEAFHGFPYALDMTRWTHIACLSDADGRVALERFPVAPGLRLSVFADGFIGKSVALDDMEWPMVIELARPDETEQPMLEGVVLDHQGMAVEGARVQLASSRTTSLAGGLFRLPIPRLASTTPLCAAKAGFQPAILPDFGERLEAAATPPGPVELVLGKEALEIRGRVVDAAGAPCAGWLVDVLDETEISQYTIPIDSAEALARTAHPRVMTDGEGRFVLTGLYPREYRVQAHERRTLRHASARALGGSLDAVLHADLDDVQDLHGVVLGLGGQPLPGVRLSVSLPTSISATGHSSMPGPTTVTNDAGEFSLEAVPGSDVYLGYSGESVVPGTYEFPEEYDPASIKIRVPRRCHFRIEAAGPYEGATSAHILDADGRRLQASMHMANGSSGSMTVPLRNGQSEVLSVSEVAATLVLFEGTRDVGRMNLQLAPETVTVLRP